MRIDTPGFSRVKKINVETSFIPQTVLLVCDDLASFLLNNTYS